jgi:two-component system, chemotaxis family, CheB/CheR fusion protein
MDRSPRAFRLAGALPFPGVSVAGSLQSHDPPAFVVGIGASAGGVEAISLFLDNDRGDIPAAFLIVMHLSADRESHLPEILSRHTSMPVCSAGHGMRLEQGKVYVIPSGHSLTVEENRLQVIPVGASERIPKVIDRLFNSLAEVYADRAIGVVLSGTGGDGALGLKAIKERGGLTIAQGDDGSSPLFSGMPKSAIAAGVVDLELPVERIAGRLAATLVALQSAGSILDARKDKQLESARLELCALMRNQLGHDFSGYKPNTFFRRVQRRMQVLQFSDIDAYVECLKATPSEVTMLFRDLLISVTSFFRDAESFSIIEQQVIPAIFRDKSANDEVRVWVPGCATGEEAYSLGMLLLEYQESLGPGAPSIRLFATDIDERALDIARRGRYPSVLLDDVSGARRERFFIEDRGHFAVQKSLRDICTFSPHNVLRDPPFSRVELVSCRNLMIYLGQELQDRILPIIHYALRPDGFLFVGVAEGATRHGDLFASVSKSHRIFRRLPGPPGSVALPPLARDGAKASPRAFATTAAGVSSGALRKQIESRIVQAHAPPYVLVDGFGEALFYSGGTGNYLEFPSGTPSRHLLTTAKKELRLALRRGLHDVVASQAPVYLAEIAVPGDDEIHRVQVTLEPFEGSESPLYLVLFHDHGSVPLSSDDSAVPVPHSVDYLERELRETREQLQSTYEEFETAIEELRVANEELMSVNEELQSSNEELETSKEELQSVNEELQTVNNEMAHHVEALDQANADLRGLLESTRIATIFLDRNLVIRSFTHAATDIFTLIPSDQGRLITDLSSQLADIDLGAHLELTVVTRKSTERAVSRKDGSKHYLMCILPYAGMAGDAGGVVMTFVDVTALVDADVRHKMMIGELNHRVRNMLAVVSAMADQNLVGGADPARLDAFLGRLHALARTYKLLTEADWSHMALGELVREELCTITGSTRFSLSGPPAALDPREALAIGMVMHELATNALRHGALSNDKGRVSVSWDLPEGPGGPVEIHWLESGGPGVERPSHRGFGTLLVERQLAYELGGRSTLSYAPEGLAVTLYLARQKVTPRLAGKPA